MNDLALCISHEFPSQLCDRVVAITNGLTEIIASFGLQLNIKAVKTDCILKLRGRSTGEAQCMLGGEGKQIIFLTKHTDFRIVQANCHLGIIFSKSGCITPEIARRCKAMLEACIPIAHMVFASSEISRSTKLQLARALLDGRGAWLGWRLYAAESSARSVNISAVPMEMVGITNKSDLNVACQGWKWCSLNVGSYQQPGLIESLAAS